MVHLARPSRPIRGCLTALLIVVPLTTFAQEPARAPIPNRLNEVLPAWVRVSTLAPLSNHGYPPDAEGALLRVLPEGLVIGVEGVPTIPRLFVPWQNVAYIAAGATTEPVLEALPQEAEEPEPEPEYDDEPAEVLEGDLEPLPGSGEPRHAPRTPGRSRVPSRSR